MTEKSETCYISDLSYLKSVIFKLQIMLYSQLSVLEILFIYIIWLLIY